MQNPFFVWNDSFLETVMAIPFDEVNTKFVQALALEKISYAKVYSSSKDGAVSKYINSEAYLYFTDLSQINVISSESQVSKEPIGV